MRISVRHLLGGCRVEAESSHNLQVVERAPRAGDLCIIGISVYSKRLASNTGKTRKMDAYDIIRIHSQQTSMFVATALDLPAIRCAYCGVASTSIRGLPDPGRRTGILQLPEMHARLVPAFAS